MPVTASADKSLGELLKWGQSDPGGLAEYAFELQAQLRQLQDVAAQNSRNSSLPPSADRGPSPKPKSLRKQSGRNTGGQPGHPGRTLQPSDSPTHVRIHRCLECSCGQNLSRQPVIDFQRRQVFDLPSLTLECTEHRAEIKDCPCCQQPCVAPFPADIKAPVQYGKNFRALLTYLYDAQQGASLRIRQMCAEMFGYPVSEATLQTVRQEQHDALEPFEKRLTEILPREPILCADETSVPVDGVTHWLHVLCTPLLTFFAIHANRGKEAIQDIGIVPKFKGWLMHDFLSGYLSFVQCRHTFCKSHLLRELIFLFEQHQQTWAKNLHDLFLALFKSVRSLKARDGPASPKRIRRWQQQYRKILAAGRRANPLTSQQKANKRLKRSKAQNLLHRLEAYEEGILAFLWELDLPFTNNEAERAFRMMKVRVKISGSFRTLDGARRHARIRSYISTLGKHGLPVLEYLRRALDGQPFLPHGVKST